MKIRVFCDDQCSGCYSIHDDLRNMVHAGLTQSLSAGTRLDGQFFGKTIPAAERFGTVEVGQRADLILLRSNRLVSVDNVREPLGVMVAGKWFSASDLNLLLQQERSKLRAIQTRVIQ